MNSIPEIGKTYNYFDDGKIRRSRLCTVKVVELIPFDDIDSEILDMWNSDVVECDRLYSKTTDFFVKGIFTHANHDPEYFVRTVAGDWFSIGFLGGALDVDGKLYERLIEFEGQ